MRSRPWKFARTSINTGHQSSFDTHFSELQQVTCAHCSLAVLCASPGEGVAFWVALSDQLWLLLAWCISLAWLLDCYQDSSLCQGQGAGRVASAYGWVTIVILSMVKRAHSNILIQLSWPYIQMSSLLHEIRKRS
jgi:hypothetical protein